MGKPPKIYPESVADELISNLDQLAQNPKGVQVKDLVLRARSKIEAAQAAGYSLEDIVKEFEKVGVSLTLNTLKQYLREVRALPDLTPAVEAPPPKRVTASSKQSESPPPSTPQPPLAAKSESSARAIAAEGESKDDDRTAKPRLTNTNEEGFQEMLNNDDL